MGWLKTAVPVWAACCYQICLQASTISQMHASTCWAELRLHAVVRLWRMCSRLAVCRLLKPSLSNTVFWHGGGVVQHPVANELISGPWWRLVMYISITWQDKLQGYCVACSTADCAMLSAVNDIKASCNCQSLFVFCVTMHWGVMLAASVISLCLLSCEHLDLCAD
jgi:hypothetical protein